jgi:hypothetical protein
MVFQIVVTASKKDQRSSLAQLNCVAQNACNKDHVIAAVIVGVRFTLEMGQRAGN